MNVPLAHEIAGRLAVLGLDRSIGNLMVRDGQVVLSALADLQKGILEADLHESQLAKRIHAIATASDDERDDVINARFAAAHLVARTKFIGDIDRQKLIDALNRSGYAHLWKYLTASP